MSSVFGRLVYGRDGFAQAGDEAATPFFTADAFIQPYFRIDAVLNDESQSFSANAVLRREQTGSSTASATILATISVALAADAFVQPYLRLNAVITDAKGLFTLHAVILRTQVPGDTISVGNTGQADGGGGTMNWTVTQGSGSALVSNFLRGNRFLDSLGTYGGLALSSIGSTDQSGVNANTTIGYRLDFTGKSSNTRSATSSFSDARYFRDFMLVPTGGTIALADSKRNYNTSGSNNIALTVDPGSRNCILVTFGGVRGSGIPSDNAGTPTATGLTFFSLWKETRTSGDTYAIQVSYAFVRAGAGPITVNRTLTGQGWHSVALFGIPATGVRVDAFIKAADGAFTANAVIRKVRSFESGVRATLDHSSATNGAATWTHTAPANAKAIVVVFRSDTVPTFVSYGNKNLRDYGNGRWVLTDLSGRDDDVVRTSGLGVHFRTSIIVSSASANWAVGDLDVLSGVTGSGNKTLTLQDTIAGNAIRFSAQIMWGDKGSPTGTYTEYADPPTTLGYDFGSGEPNTNPITGWSAATTGNQDGPSTSDLTAGWFQPATKFSPTYFVMLESAVGVLVDAWIQPSFRLDAWILRPEFMVDAVLRVNQAASFTLQATKRATISAALSADAFVQPYFRLDAWVFAPQFTADAVIHATRFTASAFVVLRTFAADILLRAHIINPKAFQADAFIRLRGFTAGAWIGTTFFWADAVVRGARAASFTANATFSAYGFTASAIRKRTISMPAFATFTTVYAVIAWRRFRVDAVIVPVVTKRFGSFRVDAWKNHAPKAGSFSLDAWYDSAIGLDSFTIDAAYVSPTRVASFVVRYEWAPVGEVRASLVVDALIRRRETDLFFVRAFITQRPPFRLDAFISARFTLDARKAFAVGVGSTTLNATILGRLTAVFIVRAVIADAVGDIRTVNLDAVIRGTVQTQGIPVLAYIFGIFNRSFRVDAVKAIGFTADAYVRPYFTVNAYILSNQYIVYPPSHSGNTGTATDTTTLYDPNAEFDSSLVGQTIIINGVEYTIASVINGQTITVSGGTLPAGQGGLAWSIPSGNPTDPVGQPPTYLRRARVVIEWSRPAANAWTDITGDVMWAGAKFTQTARIGAGSFEMPLKGAFSQFVGGEEIRVSVDGMIVFGGFVTDVERGYVFDDDFNHPVTTLVGTDYNIVLDRRLVYNEAWDLVAGGSGEYRTWKPFPQGTSDREIITTVARRFMTDPAADGFDFQTFIDEIETPAPTKGWAMEPGMPFRNVLTEVSRITEGVWYIDPLKNLQYHDRGNVTAPFPITDGDGGIACRGLILSSSISMVTNDVFVWGTEAYQDTGDSEIIFSRQTADRDWDEDWWQAKVDRIQLAIDKLVAIPFNQRTTYQRTRLSALRKTLAIYQANLAEARQSSQDGSVERYGRLQHGEFRQDIFQIAYVDRRARAIMDRYSNPVIRGEATVFDPGFQAGQVAEVVSARHNIATEIVIREMTIDFATGQKPDGGTYYGVPRYHLSFGLDPEEPWDIYQFLPFPEIDVPYTNYNPPIVDDPSFGDPIPDGYVLDTFERSVPRGPTWQTATSERSETRDWTT